MKKKGREGEDAAAWDLVVSETISRARLPKKEEEGAPRCGLGRSLAQVERGKQVACWASREKTGCAGALGGNQPST